MLKYYDAEKTTKAGLNISFTIFMRIGNIELFIFALHCKNKNASLLRSCDQELMFFSVPLI